MLYYKTDDMSPRQKTVVYDDGTERSAVPVGEGESDHPGTDFIDQTGNCPDCERSTGELHEDGCEIEHCPRCDQILLQCNCDIHVIASATEDA